MIDDVRTESTGDLGRFTRDLTAEARAGRLEPVRCRQDEIDRLVDILLRHGKNNPVLVGPAGVGKTAIVDGLAQRVAAGNVPLVLRDARILSLDHVALLAGTTYRGQYEERIRHLVHETTASSPVSASTMNSCEKEPPICPESASTALKRSPQRSKIRV